MAKTVVNQEVLGIAEKKTRPITINLRKLNRILDRLYVAIVRSEGLYKTVTVATHAPQHIFYPGSSAVQPKEIEQTPQMSLIAVNDDHQNVLMTQVRRAPLIVVEPGTEEHIRWLWFATLTDRREDSMQVYKAHCKIYEDHSEFYTKEVSYISLVDFRKALDKKYKIGSPKDSAAYWQICAYTLFSKFDGDPIKLLKHAGWSVESVYLWKQQQKKSVEKGGIGYDPIPGWGRKLISLYFLYLSEYGYPLPSDVFASDVHAQAIMIQTGVVHYGDEEVVSSSKLAEILRKAISTSNLDKKREVTLVAHASWLLGSTCCDVCSSRRDIPMMCPLYNDCGGRIDTSHYWKKGQWPKKLPVMNKGGMRPAFGLPTDVVPRLSSRGVQKVIPITPLFASRRLK